MNFSAGIQAEPAYMAPHEDHEAAQFGYLADDLNIVPTTSRQISALYSAQWVGSQSSYSSNDEASFEADLINHRDLLKAPRLW